MSSEQKVSNKQQINNLNTLPADALKLVFDHLSSKELASDAIVSKNFLEDANNPDAPADTKHALNTVIIRNSADDQLLSFASGSNARLNSLLQEQQQSFQSLQRILLHPGHQTTDVQRKLFWVVRAEIHAGRLSLNQAIEEITRLSGLSLFLFKSESPLVKAILHALDPWERKALQRGFTLADLCSNWITTEHVDYATERSLLSDLRELRVYQVRGLSLGFTVEQVRSDWFRPIHVEATMAPYHRFISEFTPHQVLREILNIAGDVAPEEWDILLNTHSADKSSHLFMAAYHGQVAILSAMREAAAYTQERWREVLVTSLEQGVSEGLTPFFIAALNGHAANIISDIQDGGGYPQPIWSSIFETPLTQGDWLGVSPLFIAFCRGHVADIKAMYEVGGYTEAQWRTAITTAVTHGTETGLTPFYAATIFNKADIFPIVKRTGNYSKAQWQALLTTPITQGYDTGKTPLFLAASKGHVRTLAEMRKAGKFTKEEWQTLINSPLTIGNYIETSPFYIAADEGNLAFFRALNELGIYSESEWHTLITTPKANFPDAGITPFHSAVLHGSMDIIAAMRAGGRYTQTAWQALITSPLVHGAKTGKTALFLAAANGHAAVIMEMQNTALYPPEEWREIISSPLTSGSGLGITPLHVAIRAGQLAALKTMLQIANYPLEAWRHQVTLPLGPGDEEGFNLLYAAAISESAALISYLKETLKYDDEVWRKLVMTPLTSGHRVGVTPFFGAFLCGRGKNIEVLKKAGGYKHEDWRALIITPLEHGIKKGLTPFHAAVANGHTDIARTICIIGNYKQAEWRSLIFTPLKFGYMPGTTPLDFAVRNDHRQILELMREAAGYTQGQWEKIKKIEHYSENMEEVSSSSSISAFSESTFNKVVEEKKHDINIASFAHIETTETPSNYPINTSEVLQSNSQQAEQMQTNNLEEKNQGSITSVSDIVSQPIRQEQFTVEAVEKTDVKHTNISLESYRIKNSLNVDVLISLINNYINSSSFNVYGKARANELITAIKNCNQNEEKLKIEIIKFLKTGQTESDKHGYSFFASPTRSSGLATNSLRGIVFDHFFPKLQTMETWLRTVSIHSILEGGDIFENIEISSGLKNS
jgi:ankyrin repeat protein